VSRRFRVAVIGAGIGRAHVEGYVDNAPHYEVAVVCDLDAERAREAPALAPAAAAETTFAAVLARPDIDLVDICLPPDQHLAAIEAALTAGKHVLCEKPLVGSLQEVDRVRRAAERAGRPVVPVYQYRFGNGIARLHRLIAAGLAGRPLVASIETHWNRLPAYYDVAWRGRKATELGGAILSHAIHVHDLVTHVLGPVRRVLAKIATRVNPIETEDCAAVVLEMASGALVTSSVTLGSAEETTRLRFCFSELTAENAGLAPYRPGEGAWRFIARGERSQAGHRQAAIDAELGALRPGKESFSGLFEALHPALCGNAPFPLTLEDAYGSLELASAIYYASATNQAVDLPLPAAHPLRAGWFSWLP
jgi:predicted dehydrogenase